MNYLYKIQKINKNEYENTILSIALVAPFVILPIQFFLLTFFELFHTDIASKIQTFSKLTVGLIYLYALPIIIKKSKIKIIGIYTIAFLIFLVNFILFPENHIHLKDLIFPVFFMCLPAFIFSICIYNVNILKRVMLKASLIVLLLGIILSTLIFIGGASVGRYSLPLSYYMLLPTIMYLDEFFEKISVKALLYALVSLMIILSLGSRGALICSALFVILKLARFDYKLSYRKMVFYFSSIGTIVALLLYSKQILEYLYIFFLNIGIESRTIRVLLSDDIPLSGRDNLYENVIREILINPILGIGIGGDRAVNGIYVHNFFLEVLANFGVIIGTILIIVFLLIIFKNLTIKNKEIYNIVIIWLGIGFFPFMMSSSYIENIKFWIMLGLLTGLLKFNKNYKVSFSRK
ncbi:O-antigen ligase family protein [Heliorestis convoluta]|uniref:O-antigen ligase like membrane family protein n=1 Tax=Heliorestis convoluta TaxID=356322 RepID=A0A5Q2N150_9FIRM|nr:O-antigen ligase family protein [Heliorestis convoluta]QGG47306.1 O-antigen ligase like membrane family protein [Heliorestis convoluta]